VRSGHSKAAAAISALTRHTPWFSQRDSRVCCEEIPLDELARRHGTPLFVYSAAGLEAGYRQMEQLFRGARSFPHKVCYSVKANSNLSVLRLLNGLGSSFDIVSGGELQRLLKIEADPRRIVFSGVGKTRQEIREALAARILLFNVESEAELELLAEEAARRREKAPAGLRINPDVQAGAHPHISTGTRVHKFGMDWSAARRIYLAHRYSRWIDWQGISTHIGSQILSPKPFGAAVERLAGYVRELAAEHISLRYVDVGGGVGIPYWREKPMPLAAYAGALLRPLRDLSCTLLLEPGRVIAGPAGVLLMRVLYTKATCGKSFVIVDAAMNDFLRPSLYGAVHPISPVVVPAVGAKARPADIVGPVCETGDCFLQDWPLPPVSPGDVLALWGAGAYGMVAASNYNSRPRPAEVLVRGGVARVIRRRETPRDLMRGE
jgi:diaminopimelate decarboxylase